MQRAYIKTITLFFIFLIMNSLQAKSIELNSVKAVVNYIPITQEEYEDEIQVVKEMYNSKGIQVQEKESKEEALNNLIENVLQMAIAKQNDIVITPEMLNEYIANIARMNGLSVEDFLKRIEDENMDLEKYKKIISINMVKDILHRELIKNTIFTDEDVKQYLKKNKDFKLFPQEYNIADLIIPLDESKLANKAINAKSLEMFAKDNPSTTYNDLGWKSISKIPSLFTNEVLKMNQNSVSKAITAPNGIHVLQLLGTREQVQEHDIQLYKIKYLSFKKNTTAETTKIVDEVYKKIKNKEISFNDAIKQYGNENLSSFEWIELKDMPENLQKILPSLSIGEVSKPIQDGKVAEIILVEGIENDYKSEIVRNYLIKKKLMYDDRNNQIKKWLETLRENSYIQINP